MLRIGSFTQIFVKNNNANQEMAMPASLPLMAVHDVVTGGCHLFALILKVLNDTQEPWQTPKNRKNRS